MEKKPIADLQSQRLAGPGKKIPTKEDSLWLTGSMCIIRIQQPPFTEAWHSPWVSGGSHRLSCQPPAAFPLPELSLAGVPGILFQPGWDLPCLIGTAWQYLHLYVYHQRGFIMTSLNMWSWPIRTMLFGLIQLQIWIPHLHKNELIWDQGGACCLCEGASPLSSKSIFAFHQRLCFLSLFIWIKFLLLPHPRLGSPVDKCLVAANICWQVSVWEYKVKIFNALHISKREITEELPGRPNQVSSQSWETPHGVGVCWEW